MGAILQIRQMRVGGHETIVNNRIVVGIVHELLSLRWKPELLALGDGSGS